MAKSTALVKNTAGLLHLVSQNSDGWLKRLPAGVSMTPDRIGRAIVNCFAKNAKLMNCSRRSIIDAVDTLAMLGLIPGSGLGVAYLVPYAKEAKPLIGYQGMIDIAVRCGAVVKVEAHCVHEKDKFAIQLGDDPRVHHEPCWQEDPGKMLAVYCILSLPNGEKQPEIMRKDQVDAIRRGSQARNAEPWSQHYEEMARKTVIRRALKRVRKSPDAAEAFAHVDADSGEIIDLGDAEVVVHEEPASQAEKLLEELDDLGGGEPPSADDAPEQEPPAEEGNNEQPSENDAQSDPTDAGAAPPTENIHVHPQADWMPASSDEPNILDIGYVDHPAGTWRLTHDQGDGAKPYGCTCPAGKKGQHCRHIKHVISVVEDW